LTYGSRLLAVFNCMLPTAASFSTPVTGLNAGIYVIGISEFAGTTSRKISVW
jgi:hypothetical protein